jgi:hypothetical protein
MTKASELAHLFRQLKAPAAARALPKLAQRAREESWSNERFCEALLSTEVASRESHTGESRINGATAPPARGTSYDRAALAALQREEVKVANADMACEKAPPSRPWSWRCVRSTRRPSARRTGGSCLKYGRWESDRCSCASAEAD